MGCYSCQRLPHRYRTTRRSSLPNAGSNAICSERVDPVILLWRVDLRVDRQCFRNHMKIQDYLWAVIHVSHSRIGTGRHGGRPSQEPEEPKPSQKKLSASAPLREITVPPKPPPTQDCPESPGVKPVATKKGSSSFTGKIPLCA